MNINALCNSPILQYTSVKPFDDGDMKYCTSLEKFERDILSLIEANYRSISLMEYYEIMHCSAKMKNAEGRVFSLVFLGGFLDNYTIVFPLLKKYKVKASMFVATGLMGIESFPGMDNFIPHFGWNHALEMSDSGLVNIFPLWHPFDKKDLFFEEIKKKKTLIELNCKNQDSFFVIAKCDARMQPKIKEAGYDAMLVDILEIDDAALGNDVLPVINVEHQQPVIDVLYQFRYLCESVAKKHSEKCSVRDSNGLNHINPSNSVKLPLTVKPMIKNYLRHAVPLGIIEALDRHRAERIVLSDYINLSYKPAYDELDYNNDLYEYWDYLSCQKITKDTLELNDMSTNSFIIQGLKGGYYADVWLDAYYIPGKYDYQKSHKTHGLLIYGYNSDSNSYYCATYTDRLLYESITVPMDAIQDATSTGYFATIVLIKNNLNVPVKYDIRLLYKRLDDYLQSVVYDDPSLYHKQTTDQYHQSNAARAFAEKVCNSGEIPTTALYCFSEHKKTMAWRIGYICEQERILNQVLTEVLKKISKNAEWLITASVKYLMSRSPKLFRQIVFIMQELNSNERHAIHLALALLKEKYNWIDK